jgi:hypothetical protein
MTNATETERPSPNVIDAKTFWRTLGERAIGGGQGYSHAVATARNIHKSEPGSTRRDTHDLRHHPRK